MAFGNYLIKHQEMVGLVKMYLSVYVLISKIHNSILKKNIFIHFGIIVYLNIIYTV